MNWEEFIYNHEEIERYLRMIHDDCGSEIELTSTNVKIPVTLLGDKINLHESQLDCLSMGNKPTSIPSFKYLEDYGIKFKRYFEIAITISSDDYSWFDGHDWNTSPLKFKIGKTQFEIGSMSNLMVMLTEPIYGEADFHYDFDWFATVKMIVNNADNYKEEFSKALFYLNSHYLKPISFYAKLKNLEFENEDPLGLFSGEDPEEIFKVAKRVRNRSRQNFTHSEPLDLYNEAFLNVGTQRFLSFYRVLEFFMEEALIDLTSKLRHDTDISEIELLRRISIRSEEEQLINLLKTITSRYQKQKFINYCDHKKIISKREFEQIAIQLYEHRNSLIHAKESELHRTKIPSPFDKRPENEIWIKIVEELARNSITKLNAK